MAMETRKRTNAYLNFTAAQGYCWHYRIPSRKSQITMGTFGIESILKENSPCRLGFFFFFYSSILFFSFARAVGKRVMGS